ncbi:MAG: hypothetical protein ACXWL5_02225 [Candidatus Chromulinivorax sp.]
MKFYHSYMIIASLLLSMQAQAAWSSWIDTISSKLNGMTDTIMHKEFPQAKQLEIHHEVGNIVINSWNQKSIAIEVITNCAYATQKDVNIEMNHLQDIVKITTHFAQEKIKAQVILNILLPKETEIAIHSKQSDIIIKDITAPLELKTLVGNIKITNPYHTVDAKTENGDIMIRTTQIAPDENFCLISEKGNIDLYTTSVINADIHAFALQGKITSDIPIKLDSKTTTLNPQAWKEFKQIVHGTIGQNISHIYITAQSGSIAIKPLLLQEN